MDRDAQLWGLLRSLRTMGEARLTIHTARALLSVARCPRINARRLAESLPTSRYRVDESVKELGPITHPDMPGDTALRLITIAPHLPMQVGVPMILTPAGEELVSRVLKELEPI
jgi:hypothetical protein